MTTQQVAEAVEAWAEATVKGLTAYSHQPDQLTKAFPLAVASALTDKVVATDQEFPAQQFEQVAVRVWRVELSLFVDPEPAVDASNLLYSIVDQLGEALRATKTLGDRVQFASPFYEADYAPHGAPEVEYPDGTVARHATFQLTVGERVEA